MRTRLPDFGGKRVGMTLRILGVTKGNSHRILEAKEGEGGEEGHGVRIYILGSKRE